MTVASLGTACHRSWTSSSHGSHHRTLCFQCGFAHAQMFPSSTVLCVLLTRSTCSGTGCYQVGLGAILLLLTLPAQYVSLSRHYACTSLISGTTFVKLLYLSYLTEKVKKKAQQIVGRFTSHKNSKSWKLFLGRIRIGKISFSTPSFFCDFLNIYFYKLPHLRMSGALRVPCRQTFSFFLFCLLAHKRSHCIEHQPTLPSALHRLNETLPFQTLH